MISVTGGHNNWWQLDLDVQPADTVLNWSFNHQTVKRMTIEEAAKYTIDIIANKYDNLYLLMSGGFDSEFVANVLYENKVPFTPLVGYAPSTNNYDYFYAMYWCKQRNIEPLTIQFDYNDIRLQKSYATICKKYQLVNDSYMVKALIEIIIERGGHTLLGETNLIHESKDHSWDDPIGEDLEVAAHSFAGSIYTNNKHPCEFFAYTPELLLALINGMDPLLNVPLAKTKLYNIPFRPKTWPIPALDVDTKEKIKKMLKVNDYPTSVTRLYRKSELISKLCKN